MYETYWRLQDKPFENNNDPRTFYHSETHQASLLKLRYLVEHQKGAGLLVGGVGFGKTYLANVLAQRLGEQFRPFVQLVYPQMAPAELMAYLAVELGADPAAVGNRQEGLDRTIRQIQLHLTQSTQKGLHPLILIDEAHLIEDQNVFQALRLLLNFQQQGQVFTLILSGQRELLSRVRRLPQLEERLGVKCVLRPLSYEETLSYVAHRMQIAGNSQPVFDPLALDALFELSGGIPRKINRLCDLALLVGFADGTDSIAAAQLEAVAEELAGAIPD